MQIPSSSYPSRPGPRSRERAQVCTSLPLDSTQSLLGRSFERAQERFGHLPGVQIQVFASASSGQVPVVVLSNAQADGPRTLQVHFHGDQLYDKDARYEEEIGNVVGRAWNRSLNTVFVLPEARNEDQAPRSDWNNIVNVVQVGQEALTKAGLKSGDVQTRILSGHSAGGSVVAKALARGEEGLAAYSQFELYDAAVSSQNNPVGEAERAKIREWCKKNPEQFLIVPGIMKSSWLEYVPKERWTEKAHDHWSPLWESLGMQRRPSGG